MADYAPVDFTAGELVEFELNGRRVSAPAGTMLVDAANALGVEVPVFCYEHRIGPPLGACRQCLVEVEGMRGLQTSCSTPVQADMVVRTNSALAKDGQDGVLEFLLENHPLDCPVCDKGGECPLQDHTFKFGPVRSRFVEAKRHFPKPLDLSPRIALDRERCISCFRCVRFSQGVAEDGALTMDDRGAASYITTLTGHPYEGRFTGNIIDLCPVGALTSIPYRFVARPWDIENVPSVCGHCSAGCNVELTEREGQVKRVTSRPDPNWEVEEGWICDRGRWAFAANRAPSRLDAPVIREGDTTQHPTLDAAVDAAALVLRNGGRVGVLVGPTATVEEAFVAQHIAATALGGAPVQRLGVPADGLEPLRALPSAQLGDIDKAGLILLVGGDPANQQAAVELRLRKARRRGAEIVTVGPRPHAWRASAPPSAAPRVACVPPWTPSRRSPGATWWCWGRGRPGRGARRRRRARPDRPAPPAPRAWSWAPTSTAPGCAPWASTPAACWSAWTPARSTACSPCTRTRSPGPVARSGAGPSPRAAPGGHRHHANAVTDRATVVLPSASHYETEGVYVAMNGRAQRLRPGATPPEGAAPGWELLIALAHRLGVPPVYRSAAATFAAAAAATPAFTGLTYDELGTLGRQIAPAPAAGNGHVPAAREYAGTGLPMVTTTRIFGNADAYLSDALEEARTVADITLHPDEAARHGLAAGARVRLRSPHGECVLPLVIDAAHPEGAAFVASGVPGAGVERLMPPDRTPVRVELSAAS